MKALFIILLGLASPVMAHPEPTIVIDPELRAHDHDRRCWDHDRDERYYRWQHHHRWHRWHRWHYRYFEDED